MENNFEMIQELLRTKAEYQARLNLIPYDGVVEIKEVSDKKYLSEEEFFGYKAIPPKMIFDIGADCILVAVQEYERIIEDFKQKAPDYMEIIPLARKFEGIK